MSQECKPILQHHEGDNHDNEEHCGQNGYGALRSASMTLGFSEGFDTNEWSLLKTSMIVTTLYVCIGVIAYSYVFEKWTLPESLFFTVVTFATIGYGDLNPSTDPARVFTTVFALCGIMLLGFAFGLIGNEVFEKEREKAQKARHVTQRKLMNLLSFKGNEEEETIDALSDVSIPIIIIDDIAAHLPYIMTAIMMSVFIGYYEDWTVVTSIYFLTITATTTGYGDIEPRLQSMRLFSAVIFIPFSVCVMGSLLEGIGSGIINKNVKRAEQKFFQRELTIHDIHAMGTEKMGKVSQMEFLQYMLIALKKVDKETLRDITTLFDKLDVGKSGYLETSDLSVRRRHAVELLTQNHLPLETVHEHFATSP